MFLLTEAGAFHWATASFPFAVLALSTMVVGGHSQQTLVGEFASQQRLTSYPAALSQCSCTGQDCNSIPLHSIITNSKQP